MSEAIEGGTKPVVARHSKAEQERWREVMAEFRGGWPVLVAGVIGSSVGVLTSIYSLAIMMRPLEMEFGWGRSQIAVAGSFFTLGLFLAGPWFGRLYDRFGVRRVGPVSVVLLALTFAALTQVRGPVWVFYAGYLALGTLGAGTSYLAYSRAVNTWFDKGRGLALAITMSGTALAATIQPFVLPPFVADHGWRAGYLALAVAALIAVPLMMFVVRERPRALQAAQPLEGLTAGQALRTRSFWLMAFGILIVGMGLVGVHLHFMPLLTDMGASQEQAAMAFALIGIGVLAGRFVTGALLDNFHAPLVVMGLFLLPAAGLILFYFVGVPAAYILAICFGLATGAEADALGYLASRFFGLRSYSEIFGWLYGFMALGGASGPLLTGFLYSYFGNYQSGLIATGVLCTVSALLFVSLGRYPERLTA